MGQVKGDPPNQPNFKVKLRDSTGHREVNCTTKAEVYEAVSFLRLGGCYFIVSQNKVALN